MGTINNTFIKLLIFLLLPGYCIAATTNEEYNDLMGYSTDPHETNWCSGDFDYGSGFYGLATLKVCMDNLKNTEEYLLLAVHAYEGGGFNTAGVGAWVSVYGRDLRAVQACLSVNREKFSNLLCSLRSKPFVDPNQTYTFTLKMNNAFAEKSKIKWKCFKDGQEYKDTDKANGWGLRTVKFTSKCSLDEVFVRFEYKHATKGWKHGKTVWPSQIGDRPQIMQPYSGVGMYQGNNYYNTLHNYDKDEYIPLNYFTDENNGDTCIRTVVDANYYFAPYRCGT